MPKTKTPVQILNNKRKALLKAQHGSLLGMTVKWLELGNPENPLHQEYDRQLRAARVTLHAIIKQLEEK